MDCGSHLDLSIKMENCREAEVGVDVIKAKANFNNIKRQELDAT